MTTTGFQRFLPHGVPQLHEDVTGGFSRDGGGGGGGSRGRGRRGRGGVVVVEERIGHPLDVIIGTPRPHPPVLVMTVTKNNAPPPPPPPLPPFVVVVVVGPPSNVP